MAQLVEHHRLNIEVRAINVQRKSQEQLGVCVEGDAVNQPVVRDCEAKHVPAWQ